MGEDVQELNIAQRVAMMKRAANVAAWAGHAWARYNDWERLEKIAREAPVEEWPAKIEQAALTALEGAARANPVARQIIFLAERLAPSAQGGTICVEIGAHDQLRAYIGAHEESYEYHGRRRHPVRLRVVRGEYGAAIDAIYWNARYWNARGKGRDIARVVAAALAADPGAKWAIQRELARILRGARAVEFAVRILDAGNCGHMLAR